MGYSLDLDSTVFERYGHHPMLTVLASNYWGFLEQRGLSYIVVARLTLWLNREAARVTEWRALDPHYAVGENPVRFPIVD